MQGVGEMLLSQALLPISAAPGVSTVAPSMDEAGASVLHWNLQDQAAAAGEETVEEALLKLLRFVAGRCQARIEELLHKDSPILHARA